MQVLSTFSGMTETTDLVLATFFSVFFLRGQVSSSKIVFPLQWLNQKLKFIISNY